MANATANVQLNVTGNAQQQLAKTQRSVQQLQDSFSKLRNVVAGLAIGALVTNMFRAADALNDVSDATGLATSTIQGLSQAFIMSGGSAEGAQNAIVKLYQSIDDAASGNDKLIKSFEKVGVSLSDLGNLSEEEILNRVVTNLGKLGNNSEAIGLKMELLGKQARGVNLENVANQFQRLTDEAKLAEPSIASIGKLFDNLDKFKGDFAVALGQQFGGLLSTLEKLTSNTESLAKSLAELVKIVTILGTAFLIFAKVLPAIKSMGDAMFATGAAGKFFSNQMKYIFINLKNLPKNIGAFVLSLVGLKDALAATAARAGGLLSLGAAMLNILRIGLRFAGIVGIVIGVAQALNFLIKTITGFDVLDWLGEKLSYVGTKLKEFAGLLLAGDTNYFKDTAEGATETADALEEVNTNAASTRDRLKEIREENAKFLVSVRDITKEYREQNIERLQLLANDIKYLSMTEEQIALDKNRNEVHKEFVDTLDQLAKKRAEAMADPSKGAAVANQIDAEIKKVQESAVITQTESARKIKAYYAVSAAIKEQKAQLEDLGRAFAQSEALQQLEDELSLIGLTGDALEQRKIILEAERALREEMQRLSISLLDLELERAKIGEQAYQAERSRIMQQMTDAQALSNAKIKAYEDEQKRKTEIDASYAEGAARAMQDIAEQFKPINMAQEAVQKGFSAIGNAVDTFVETGKFKFSDFARSILADLAKMIAKAMIFRAISGIAGAFGLSIPGLAKGGPAKAGQPYIVGEQGPELFVPQGSGTVVPNNKLGSKGVASGAVNAPVTNNYITNNINAIDAKGVAQLFAENRKTLLGSVKMAEREMPYMAR
jgi:lambda family phage tail tape measure protein